MAMSVLDFDAGKVMDVADHEVLPACPVSQNRCSLLPSEVSS